jgi:serine/threonine protein kinase
MSPERLLGLDCGFASDSWSVGILSMELLLGRPPYDMQHFDQYGANALFEFKKQVVTEPSPSIKRGDDYSDEVRLFVDSCLHKNLKLRLSIAGLLSHPFITKYESFLPNFLGRWISRDTKKASKEKKRRESLKGGQKESIFSMLADAAENKGEEGDEHE